METSVGAKLLGLLKDIAPRLTRIAVLINPDNPGSPRLSESAASAARKFAVDVVALPVRNSAEIEAAMARWGREPGAGLIVPPDPSTNSYRQLIVELASRYRIPAIHTLRAAAVDGALMSYGVDIPSLHREAASYVDRILKGEKPADLPVQQPTKFEFVINLKTAKTLGLKVPPTLLARRRGDRIALRLLHLLATGYGTNLPIRNVRFHGESWRVSGRATEIVETTFMTRTGHALITM